jgi:hypothetical protein
MKRPSAAGPRDDAELLTLVHAIVAEDASQVSMMLAKSPSLATRSFRVGATRASAKPFYLTKIEHYVYEGDTALHVAAAAYDGGAVRDLVEAGAHFARDSVVSGR